MNGVVVGTVASEPDDLGRVEVRYDWMEGDNRSFRAPIATLMSGNRRGSWLMPEIGDEVLVAFDHGRFEHPFIVGFLWNGGSRPPQEGIDRRVRRLQTVSGHRLDFDDRDGSTKITLRSAQGHTLSLDDASRTIKIESSGGVSIELDPNGGVKVTAARAVEVTTPKATFSGEVEAAIVTAQMVHVTSLLSCPNFTPGRGSTYP